MTNNDIDISRPTVSVKLPVVMLNLADLSFLRSLSQPKSVRCYPKLNTLDKLRFLDLIARVNIPPLKEAQEAVAIECTELKKKLLAAIQKENWSDVSNLGYNLKNLHSQLKPTEDDVLTEKGKLLLRQGECSIRVRKVGCAK
jgi:hypothetical protein